VRFVTGAGSLLFFRPPLDVTPVSPTSSEPSVEMQVNADITLATPTLTSLTPTGGPLRGGPTVTITGQGLGAASVKFGTAPATMLSNTSTAITVTPPDQPPGPVDVTVTTAGGTTAPSAASRYRYFEKPVVTDVTPATGPTAGGTQVTLRGSGFTGATAVRFGDAAGRIVTLAPTKIVAVSPSHAAGAVDVTVVNPGVTSDTSVADGFTYSDAAPAAQPGGSGSQPGTSPSPGGPQLTGLSITPHTLGRRTTAQITYRLNRDATVRFTLKRRARCRTSALSAGTASARTCLRSVRGGLTDAGQAGANAQTFSGRMRGRRLAPGSYVLSAQATDGAGLASAGSTIRFRIRR
jgi:hypothetical protein